MAALLRIALCLLVSSLVVVRGVPHHQSNLLARMQSATCAGAGHTDGCCQGGSSTCSVSAGSSFCFCDEGCHRVGQCCPDIVDVGCIPTTCYNAGLHAGCCRWLGGLNNCRVTRFQGCFCDRQCHFFGDCCDDVPRSLSHLNCRNRDIISKVQDEKPFPFNLMQNRERLDDALLESLESRMRATSQNSQKSEGIDDDFLKSLESRLKGVPQNPEGRLKDALQESHMRSTAQNSEGMDDDLLKSLESRLLGISHNPQGLDDALLESLEALTRATAQNRRSSS